MAKRLPLFLMATIILISADSYSQADWLGNWVQQKTSASPGYFAGQKRGYFSAGSFSARWKNTHTVNLVDAEPPGISAGCGGIDIFGGGLGFINPQYLVQQLQLLLQAAPAVAFNMALNTVCQPCTKVINTIKSIVDRLNGLQMNACHDAHILAAKLVSAVSPEARKKYGKEADTQFDIVKGFDDLFQSAVEKEGATPSGGSTNASLIHSQSGPAGPLAGCPSQVKELFDINSGTGTTVLKVEGTKYGLSADAIDLIRGMVGDVRVAWPSNSKGKKAMVVQYIPPCDQTKNTSIEDFYSGNIKYEEINADGSYSKCYTPSNPTNLIDEADKKVAKLITAIKSSNKLNASDEAYINNTPAPVYAAIKAAIIEGQEIEIGANLADIIARANAYGAMSDMYQRLRMILYIARRDATQATAKTDCQVELLEPGQQAIEDFLKGSKSLIALIKSDYLRTVNESNNIGNLARRYDTMASTAYNVINKHLYKKQ